jgi:hypothetical protein
LLSKIANKRGIAGKGQFCHLVELKKQPPTHFNENQKNSRQASNPKNIAAMPYKLR